MGVGHLDVSDLVGRVSLPEAFVCSLRSPDGSRHRGWLSITLQSFVGLTGALDSSITSALSKAGLPGLQTRLP